MSAQASFALRGRNPDVLTCIANLSNDEVFTPPEFANRMLDTLAEAWAADNGGANIWADKTVRFLDPCTKSGVFLREITSRLTKGLADEIPDLEERVDHILTKQVFGIGITHLTSLLARRSVYCSKHAKGKHSIAKVFASDDGNIWFERTRAHVGGRQVQVLRCASRTIFDRGEGLETHAYAFIHTDDIKTRIAELFGGDMQFDVIIGNPPYQMTGGGWRHERLAPIYHLFVEQAHASSNRATCSMVIPSRWMAGGRGLGRVPGADAHRPAHLRNLVDYPEAATDVFPGVEIKGGICYFLWDRDTPGHVRRHDASRGDEPSADVDRQPWTSYDVFVRDKRGCRILEKVLATGESRRCRRLSAGDTAVRLGDELRRTCQDERAEGWTIRSTASIRTASESGTSSARTITKNAHLIDKWKVLRAAAATASGDETICRTRFSARRSSLSPASVCTETYLVVGPFELEERG